MAQLKIYGLKKHLEKVQKQLSSTIHKTVVVEGDVVEISFEFDYERFGL